ncbi:isochorismatase family protein, partial [Clavibacter michiganensis]|uniref:isochorismatase family protein n=3 Tax=Clavibacter michiganensis TaxID=28447 RepID=UPI00374E1237
AGARPGVDPEADAPETRARYRRILRFAAWNLAATRRYELFLPRVGLRRIADGTGTPRLTLFPRRALVLVDVQQEYFAGPLEIRHPDPALSVRVIGRAIDAATEAGIPVVVVQHDSGAGAPVFDPTTDAFRLHPELESRRTEAWKAVTKSKGSVFAGTDLVEWVRAEGVDTITLVGYMTNNCILASSVEAEGLDIAAEVLSDATGAIAIANAAGSVDAATVHGTLMALLHSNFAAVATTDAWIAAVAAGEALPKDGLATSATAGAARFGTV